VTDFTSIARVWSRYFSVYRKNIAYGIVTTFVEPLLYLFAFGFGLGGMIGKVTVLGRELSYRQFVFAGIVGQTVLIQSFFDAAFGSFVRMYYQRIFQSIAMTPITLSEVLWAELLWDATKGTISAAAILLIGAVAGDFSPWGALIAVPCCFAASFLFAGLGLLTAAKSRTIEEISFPQYLLVFPMFLFCAVFFPLERLPGAAQAVIWLLPLTGVVSGLRTLLLGTTFEPVLIPVLLVWGIGLTFWSRRAMLARLVK
jgi:lipooligosaccharide transport system permease protein